MDFSSSADDWLLDSPPNHTQETRWEVSTGSGLGERTLDAEGSAGATRRGEHRIEAAQRHDMHAVPTNAFVFW